MDWDATTWTQALRNAEAGLRERSLLPVQALAPAVWLAAALLDLEGSRPEQVLAGATLVVCPSPHVQDALVTLLESVWEDDGIDVVDGPRREPGWALTASRTGVPVVVLAADEQDVVEPSSLAAIDRTVRLPQAVLREALVATVVGVTGGRPTLPGDLASMSVGELLSCVRVGDSTMDAERRLKAWAEAKRPANAARAVSELAKLKGGDGDGAGGDAPRPKAKPHPRLSEMSGFGEAGRWGIQLAADLRAYATGALPWDDVDRGVLLSGPPGCGKTTFAKALAAECGHGIQFASTTYNEWSAAGGGVGDSMSKGMTKLFEGWREKSRTSPLILFVDEIDTIGRRGGNDNNESWYGAVINSWLAFLDGAVPRDGIVVVAATNHPDRVDPALLRPGRLDRHVVLERPGVDALAGVVRHHLGEGAIVDDASLRDAARACRGMSPAEVALACRDARRAARQHFRRPVTADDVSMVLGARRLQILSQPGAADQDRRVAVHEAAHAIAVLRSAHEDLLSVDLDSALTWSSRPAVETLASVEARLTVLLAGLVAEDLLLGGHSSGAGQDLVDATTLCVSAQARWGMGARGLRVLPADAAVADPAVAAAVDGILASARARARAMVEGSREAVERLAEALRERRYLDAAEVREVVEGPSPPGVGP